MKIQTDYNLFALNTFKLNSIARYFYELDDRNEISEITKWAKEKNVQIRILGGGSNLILPDKIDALVIKNNLTGVQKVSETSSVVSVRCASGENWHQFVMSQIAAGHFGLENLALIPGTVGGAPIQNIGAYGVEVNGFIKSVTGFDFNLETFRTLQNKDCLFDYRNSVFKKPAYSQFLVTEVNFELKKIAAPVISYAELAQTFAGKTPSALEVANKVIEVRQKKLPDVGTIPNVGSFFKNPIVSKSVFRSLKNTIPDVISYALANGDFKLAAGQLIDKLGFKGKSQGTVGMYDKQALVMINLGLGNVDDVKALVQKIVSDCHTRFGVTLETEPIFW